MIQLENQTPLVTAGTHFVNGHGEECLSIVAKATYTIPGPGEKAKLAEEQLPIFLADQYFGDPQKTGIRYPVDLVPQKPATDIGLNGCVYSPGRATHKAATLEVGPVYKALLITGDRYWRYNLFFWGYSRTKPKPFTRMPLCYENAYGGRANGQAYKPNPIGTGFMVKKNEAEGIKLPNIEDPDDRATEPMRRPYPAGFGFIPPTWEKRLKYAGTRDEAWQRDYYPLPPKDLDPRYFNAAAEGLTAEGYLKGGETVTLTNMSPRGDLTFTLPDIKLNLIYRLSGNAHSIAPDLWTIILEPDEERFILIWGASIETMGMQVENLIMEIDQNMKEIQG